MMTQEGMKNQIVALKSMLQESRARGDALQKENAELKAERAEAAETHKRIMSEKCPGDEQHCTCVPALRAEIVADKGELINRGIEIERLRSVLYWYSRYENWSSTGPEYSNIMKDGGDLARTALEPNP